MQASVEFDALEVVLLHPAQADKARTLSELQDAVEPWYEVEPLEQVSPGGGCRQVVRLASAMGERFGSATGLEESIRALTGYGFAWERVGAIRAGGPSAFRV